MEYSRIGLWSEAKLRILKECAKPYSTILKNQYGFSHAYIDAFAGAGWHVSRRTDEFLPGSPLNALLVEPPFDDYYFVDVNLRKVAALRELADKRSDVHI
jgi:three-Cys-motif partner protein